MKSIEIEISLIQLFKIGPKRAAEMIIFSQIPDPQPSLQAQIPQVSWSHLVIHLLHLNEYQTPVYMVQKRDVNVLRHQCPRR